MAPGQRVKVVTQGYRASGPRDYRGLPKGQDGRAAASPPCRRNPAPGQGGAVL